MAAAANVLSMSSDVDEDDEIDLLTQLTLEAALENLDDGDLQMVEDGDDGDRNDDAAPMGVLFFDGDQMAVNVDGAPPIEVPLRPDEAELDAGGTRAPERGRSRSKNTAAAAGDDSALPDPTGVDVQLPDLGLSPELRNEDMADPELRRTPGPRSKRPVDEALVDTAQKRLKITEELESCSSADVRALQTAISDDPSDLDLLPPPNLCPMCGRACTGADKAVGANKMRCQRLCCAAALVLCHYRIDLENPAIAELVVPSTQHRNAVQLLRAGGSSGKDELAQEVKAMAVAAARWEWRRAGAEQSKAGKAWEGFRDVWLLDDVKARARRRGSGPSATSGKAATGIRWAQAGTKNEPRLTFVGTTDASDTSWNADAKVWRPRTCDSSAMIDLCPVIAAMFDQLKDAGCSFRADINTILSDFKQGLPDPEVYGEAALLGTEPPPPLIPSVPPAEIVGIPVTPVLPPSPVQHETTRGHGSGGSAQKDLTRASYGVEGRDPAALLKAVALVIGIQNYEGARELKNTLSDAKAVAAKFEGMGFDVMSLTDDNAEGGKVDQDQMEDIIQAFIEMVDENTIAVFAYMGASEKACAEPTYLSSMS